MLVYTNIMTRLPAHERRDSILDAAKNILAARGLEGVTTAAIASQAGISEPILYRHFPSKRALLEQLLREVIERVTGELAGIAESEADPVRALRRVIEHYPALSRTHAKDFVIINRALAEGQDGMSQKMLRGHYEGYVSVLEAIITRGQVQGRLRRDVPAEVGAWHLIHAALGYFFTRPLKARGQSGPCYEAGLAELALSGLLV